MIKKLMLGVAFGALSTAALAADLPARTIPAPAPLPVFTWTGFYVGGTLGVVNHGGEVAPVHYANQYGLYDGNFAAGSNTRSNGIGAMAGVQAGYNYQIGQMVLGVEADYSLASAGKQTVTVVAYDPDTYFGKFGSKLTSLGTVRARVGVAFDRALVYATGGFAFGNVKSNLYDDYEPLGYTTSGMRTGWTVGAGVEYALNNNVTVKAEGLYYSLGSKTTANQNFDSVGSSYASYKDKSDGLIARLGVNYKF